ncbi:MAG: hypothetical protein MUQ99_10850 [Pseudomonadales bacterium]|nr:hypothetical protein [Pseudomonadales bacterium]
MQAKKYSVQLTAKLRKPSTCDDLDVIALTIARCVSRYLEKSGYLVRDAESEYLELMQDQKDAKGAILGARTDTSDRSYRLHSVQMQGAEPSTKSLTLLTVPVRTEPRKGSDLVRQPGRIIASIQGPDVIPDASDRSDPEATGTRSEKGSIDPLTASRLSYAERIQLVDEVSE